MLDAPSAVLLLKGGVVVIAARTPCVPTPSFSVVLAQFAHMLGPNMVRTGSEKERRVRTEPEMASSGFMCNYVGVFLHFSLRN